jgi:hypothetical protein
MAVDATQVIVGQAYCFTAPSGTAYPADDVPANQGVNGTFSDWTSPAGWVNIGATQEGVTLGVVQNANDINIEEQSTPARVTVSSTDISVSVVLSEDVLETLKLAYGGGTITTTAAATGVMGKKQLVLAEGITEIALGFDGLNKFGFHRRVKIPRVASVANVQTAYRRAADARRYAVTFRALVPPSQITIFDKTAAALP